MHEPFVMFFAWRRRVKQTLAQEREARGGPWKLHAQVTRSQWAPKETKQNHKISGSWAGYFLFYLRGRKRRTSRSIYPETLGCGQPVPQSLSKGRGGLFGVGDSGMKDSPREVVDSLVTTDALCQRRRQHNSFWGRFPSSTYLFTFAEWFIDSTSKPVSRGSRKSPSLKPQCPCEVLLCGTFLKNNHIRGPSGWRNPQTTVGLRQDSAAWSRSLGSLVRASFLYRESLGRGLNIRFTILDTKGCHIPKERIEGSLNSEWWYVAGVNGSMITLGAWELEFFALSMFCFSRL